MARDIRVEVRGSSAALSDRRSQLKAAADRCEQAARGARQGCDLGSWRGW